MKSTHPYKSLTISGKLYSENGLMDFVNQQFSRNSVSSWQRILYEFISEWLSDSPNIKVKTSGSTGNAKWIGVEKEKMVKSAQLTGQFFDLKKNDNALLCLPVDFIAGKMMVVRAFVLGLNLIPVEPSGNPINSLNEPLDFAAMTPMQVYSILKEKNGIDKLNQIKNLIIGGGEISNQLLNEIRKLHNNTYHTYGMTETLTHVALKKLNGKKPDLYFKALPGIKFKKDKRNCLVVIASHLSDQDFITNDVVDLKDNKTFDFIGRYDNVINSGGLKVFPESIEQKLQPFITDRFIIGGLPDEKLGQKVVLVIEQERQSDVDFKEVFKELSLSKPEIPKEVYLLDSFPETESGKIVRQLVLQRVLEKTLTD